MSELEFVSPLDRTSIRFAPGLCHRIADFVAQTHPPPRKVGVVTDTAVASSWLAPVTEGLEERGYEVVVCRLPPGEGAKNPTSLQAIWDQLLRAGLERSSVVVGLGGGVVGDLSGFAASTLLRGVAHVQVPTTLLAQVDASVGGKTAINHPAGKNLIGTFWQPRWVLVDPETLATLPLREFRAGLAEMIKYGMTHDPSILAALRAEGNTDSLRRSKSTLHALIERCLEIKSAVVQADPREAGERVLLNFGHTAGHGIEAAGGFQAYLHGEAVGLGMLVAARLAALRSLSGPEPEEELRRLLTSFDLPTATRYSPDQVEKGMQADKKKLDGELRWVLVRRPGEAEVIRGVPREQVRAALAAVHEPGAALP